MCEKTEERKKMIHKLLISAFICVNYTSFQLIGTEQHRERTAEGVRLQCNHIGSVVHTRKIQG